MNRTLRTLAPLSFSLLVLGTLLVVRHLKSEPREATHDLLVQVQDDARKPLAEVPVTIDGQLRGVTDAHGQLRCALSARATSRITVACPESYRDAAPSVLRGSDRPRALELVCRPRLRTLAVVVHAPAAAGLILRADDQALGRVAEDGTLHAVLRRAPGEVVQLKLDPRPPTLGASAPVRTVHVDDHDRVVLFDPQQPTH